MNADRLLDHYERIADAPDAVHRLRRFILDLAVRGKLVEQNPEDESAAELLKQIAAEKARLVKEGKIRQSKTLPPIQSRDLPVKSTSGWIWTRLGDASTLITKGSTPTSYGHAYTDGGINFIKIEAIKDGELRPENVTSHISEKTYDYLARSKLVEGDILFSIAGSIGTCAIVSDEILPANTNQALSVIRGTNQVFFSKFLLLCLQSSVAQFIHAKARGGAMNNISLGDVASFVIPLPPLAEQHRIVAKVDELMALCDRLEAARAEREAARDRMAAASLVRLNDPDPAPEVFRNHAAFTLDNLTPLTTRPDQIKALRQTILNLAVRGKLVEQDPNDEPTGEALKRIGIEREELVQREIIRRDKPLAKIGADEPPFEIPREWRWKRIGEVALFTQYGTSTKSIHSGQGIPVLTMGNIQDGAVVWRNEKKIPAPSEELPALFLKQFDLLYNRTNSAELVGKTGIYLGEDDCKTFASYLIRIQLSRTSSSPHYVNLAMNAPVFRETQIVPLIKKQTGQANVNGTALKNMLIPMPPVLEQHRIVANVDRLLALCDRLEARLTSSDHARRRMLEALLQEVLAPSAEIIRQDNSTIAQQIPDKPRGRHKTNTDRHIT